MQFIKTACFLFIFTLFVSHSFAQDAPNEEEKKLSLTEGTIDNQFEYLIQKSNNYQEYKVIKKTWLTTLKAHTIDSLNAVHKELSDTQELIETQSGEIAQLKDKLSNTKSTLTSTVEEKDSMLLFGIQMSKTGYNIMLWSIIGGLLACLLVFIYKFKKSNVVTKQARLTLAETEAEFEEHRRNALEREQKVRRQLQDEINKQKTAGK